ncbi:MAG TPA: alpha/beta hydrolase [Opitutaceae bacterium]|nr:alpha/beta hydrolase [Opitutaceae bacterium]
MRLHRILFPVFLFLGVSASPAGMLSSSAEQPAWDAFNQSGPPAETVRYLPGSNPLHELDLYPASSRFTKNGGQPPVLILIHGGGWGGGTREALAPHARYFAALGWECVNISYRLTNAPGVTLMNAQEDVRAAFDWVRAEAGKRGWDATHLVALGESAGGQLACALGILPPDPKRSRAHSLVLINPVLDLTKLSWALNQPGLREAGAFNDASAKEHPARLVSPVFNLNAECPPVLLVHGRDDSVVPFSQAEAFAARAKQVNANVSLVPLEKTNHAFLLREYGSPDVMRSTLKQIAEYLGPH